MKRNYQRELDDIIKGLERVPTLFLHVCCAPCSSYVLEYLSEYFEITVFYYNPNIYPEEEYHRRLRELMTLIEKQPHRHPVHFRECAYEPAEFFDAVKGLEKEPEGGDRCRACFRLRLRESASIAREGGFDYFTTTLSISPLKNAETLNEIGEEEGAKAGVRYLPSDFKKKNGYLRSIELSREYGLYRQDYCGCVFSKAETEERRTKNET